jgi:hypothetical protein
VRGKEIGIIISLYQFLSVQQSYLSQGLANKLELHGFDESEVLSCTLIISTFCQKWS